MDIQNIQATLKNWRLWHCFYSLDTEMIVTRTGRRMFPTIEMELQNLNPNLDYCVALELMPACANRYKYCAENGWLEAGPSDDVNRCKLYIHPDSPAKGQHWLSQTINFHLLKLTNTQTPTQPNQIVLHSMHRYQPIIWIYQSANPSILFDKNTPRKSLTFRTTEFVAVTTYQNTKVRKLKINSNPFAKGFRKNGKSYIKKKIRCNNNDSDSEEEKNGQVGEARSGDGRQTASSLLASSTVSPPLAASALSLPLSASALSLPLSASAVSPPFSASVVSPPLTASAASLPLAASAVSPPFSASVVSPPLAASAASLPLSASAVSPPLAASVVSPPLAASVVSPPFSASAVAPPLSAMAPPLPTAASTSSTVPPLPPWIGDAHPSLHYPYPLSDPVTLYYYYYYQLCRQFHLNFSYYDNQNEHRR